jgi:hypothetical protein
MAAPFVPAPGPGLRGDGDGDALVSWAERTAHGDRRAPGRGMLRFVFYGRVSTEDWQDPVTSRARQREQVDYASEHDEKTMTVLGLSSKREITRTSIRVRAAMAAQTREQGRYLDGRPPFFLRSGCGGRPIS